MHVNRGLRYLFKAICLIDLFSKKNWNDIIPSEPFREGMALKKMYLCPESCLVPTLIVDSKY